MKKQLKTWKISLDRYNSNGLGQRLACEDEVRRFGPVTPRFVILSLAVRRTSCGRQTKFNKRALLLIANLALLTEYKFHTMQCLSHNWKTRLF